MTPPTEESLMCAMPWHASCLSSPPETLASTLQWECPDCSGEGDCLPIAFIDESDLVAAILAIEDSPVTAPCGHNFCMKCFGKWTIGQGKRTCAECRKVIPLRMVRNPWINSALVSAIRLAKAARPSTNAISSSIKHKSAAAEASTSQAAPNGNEQQP
ncbi:unnamed protein product [Microthlaspi erraticum]|uniref:RING-type E3 ubiquitin transferase n=1 Tax=Microthlaspi erraticum TaxID=1685480 RepID=A0A6D2KDL7_9BRAS|nr:unnamed protein product [Microthlaspi erraticum]